MRSSKGSPRAKHVLPTPHLPSSKHRPSLKTERFQRGRSCGTEGKPFGAPPRGSTDTSCLSEGGPGADAPHGILAGPRQPLVPFPCGKGTRASADARNSHQQHSESRRCVAFPTPPHLQNSKQTARSPRTVCFFPYFLTAPCPKTPSPARSSGWKRIPPAAHPRSAFPHPRSKYDPTPRGQSPFHASPVPSSCRAAPAS